MDYATNGDDCAAIVDIGPGGCCRRSRWGVAQRWNPELIDGIFDAVSEEVRLSDVLRFVGWDSEGSLVYVIAAQRPICAIRFDGIRAALLAELNVNLFDRQRDRGGLFHSSGEFCNGSG